MMFEGIADQAKQYVDDVWEDVVADIAQLVAVRSVADEGPAEPGAPWGAAARAGLDAGLAVCERLGLATTCCDGYVGWADARGSAGTANDTTGIADATERRRAAERAETTGAGGAGAAVAAEATAAPSTPGASGAPRRQIALVAHTDVVPEGDGWTLPPFQLTRRDGCLAGRGVMDDKGPFVLAAYAVAFFDRLAARMGAPLPCNLRLIAGTCEETTMEDVRFYLQHEPAPDFCFSPDADFPLICGEKGILHGRFTSEVVAGEGAPIAELWGGTVENAVPSSARAVERGVGAEGAAGAPAERVVRGRGGHASMPQGTENAIGMLCAQLVREGMRGDDSNNDGSAGNIDNGDNGAAIAANAGGCSTGATALDQRPFLRLAAALGCSWDGSAAGLACENERFGPLTLVASTLRTEGGRFILGIDCRYPDCITGEQVVAALTELGREHGCTFEATGDKAPFYLDPATPEVDALMRAYAQVAGDTDARPIAIGGGTYARLFPRACAFGANDPREQMPEWAGPEHGPNEAMSEASLRRALQIYILAIANLMQLE